MEESVLTSTKKLLGIDQADTSFDQDVLTHINSAFSHLQQLGIGPDEGSVIVDDTTEWDDIFVDTSTPILSQIKPYVYLKVRSIFDPPQMQHLMTAMNEQIREYEVRLSMMREAVDWVNPNPPVPLLEDDWFEGTQVPDMDGGGA